MRNFSDWLFFDVPALKLRVIIIILPTNWPAVILLTTDTADVAFA